MMAALIVLSFALLGATFIGLSYRYTVTEKREAMERNADILTELESIDYASLNASGMEEAVEERRQYTCDTFAFDKTGFTATCDLDEDVLMFFSVPYDSGCGAAVNGGPVVIEKAGPDPRRLCIGRRPGAAGRLSAGDAPSGPAGRCRGPGACQLPQPAGAPGGEHPVRADRADSGIPGAGSGTARTGDPGREGGTRP